MVHMTTRAKPLLALTLATAAAVVACVPDPRNRDTPPPADVGGAPTPVPTPAGPTPTPSFVRPTPTPAPTFALYTVRTGDTLEKIAKRYRTTVRSISYWNRATYPSLDPESSAYKPNDIKVGWVLQIIPDKNVDPENLPPASGQPLASPSPAPSALF
jgi:Tfp pilus assembly protein FimV